VPNCVAALRSSSKEREPTLDKLEEEIWVLLGGTVMHMGMKQPSPAALSDSPPAEVLLPFVCQLLLAACLQSCVLGKAAPQQCVLVV
jgi:hypothetical protein